MTNKEKKIQIALGTMFKCTKCQKVFVIRQLDIETLPKRELCYSCSWRSFTLIEHYWFYDKNKALDIGNYTT